MFKNCSCHVSPPIHDEHAPEAGSTTCKPCSAKSMLAMLAGIVGAAIVLAVLTRAVWSAEGDAPALESYCPICVTQMGKWVKGSAEHQATYDGKTYYFPSQQERSTFLADPAKYVPALGGDCTVCYAKTGKRVAGSIRHAARHDGRLFLFPSDREKQAFLDAPEKFAAKSSAGEMVVARRVDTERQQIRVEGRSGCAACEHGVKPIGASDTLGLAVNSADGRVYVIEDAHQLYPQVYKDRFSGLKLSVAGEVVKQNGKVTWLRPASLNVVN